jgi:uncharacterized membrane protein YhhN
LTTDSSASESKLTEPVSKYAMAFSAMVVMAAAIESQAKRVSDERFVLVDVMGWIDILTESVFLSNNRGCIVCSTTFRMAWAASCPRLR